MLPLISVVIPNSPYLDDFCHSARWAAKSRVRVQHHPSVWMLIAIIVLEKENNDVNFIDDVDLSLTR